MFLDTHPKQWQKAIQKIAALKPASWLLSHTLHYYDNFTLWLTGGRNTLTDFLTGTPVVILTTIGAKNGEQRSVPLLGFADGDDVILIASNWGRKHHPAWYFNLIANPEARLDYKGRNKMYLAREATPDERERYWGIAVSNYAGYADYKVRAGARKIPIIVLTPKSI